MNKEIIEKLQHLATEERRLKSLRFFKTGEGEYGSGDCFIGVSVPDIRSVIKPYIKSISLGDIEELLTSHIHEVRLAALYIMVDRYKRDKSSREELVTLFLNSIHFVNNWDLVDSSAHKILGPWLTNRDRVLLYDFANSGDLWLERIAIMTTFHFIKDLHEFDDTFKIAELLLNHPHDLIHKAVGWMLREVGNISIDDEEDFLKKYYKKMPRTMLRYAIEKFPEEKRKRYLKGEV